MSMEMWQLWHRPITNTGWKEMNHCADLLSWPLYHLIAKACSIVVDWFPRHRINVKTKCDFQHWKMEINSHEKPKANQSKQLLRHVRMNCTLLHCNFLFLLQICWIYSPSTKACSKRWHQTFHFTMYKTICHKKKKKNHCETLKITSARLNNKVINLNRSQSLGEGSGQSCSYALPINFIPLSKCEDA